MSQSITAIAWACIIALSVLWGGSFFFNELALREFDAMWVAFFRVFLGALGLIVFNLATRRKMPRDTARWRDIAVMGLINNVIPFSLICWGQTRIEAGAASILNATLPLFTVILVSFVLKEATAWNKTAGVVVGMVGVAIMVGVTAMSGLLSEGFGQLAILGAAVSYAFAVIWGRRLRDLDVSVSAAGMLICSTVIMLPIALSQGLPNIVDASAPAWLSLVALGLLCSSVGYLLYFKILNLAGPTNTSLVTFLIPVSALLLSVAFLGERPGPETWLGMAMIFAGLALVDGRLVKRG